MTNKVKLKNRKVFQLGLLVCLLLLLTTTLQLTFWPDAFMQPIYVNNDLVILKQKLSLKKVLKQLNFPAFTQGVLTDVDNLPIDNNFPLQPVIKVNSGHRGDTLSRGDKVFVNLQKQKQEPVKKIVQTVSLPTLIKGQGVFAFLTAKGEAGKKVLKVGKYSNKLVAAKYIDLGQPEVVTRSDVALDKVVALTFDDGPFPPFTNQIRDILKQQQIKATFFVVGRQIALYPQLIKELTQDGFLIGNHSYSHSALGGASDEVLQWELNATRDLIVTAGGKEPHWFRPPFGSTSDRLGQLAAAKGYRVVSWNVDSMDWANKDANFIANQVIVNVKPGAIVLLHDGGGDRTNTVAALPQIIQKLKEQGYKFVTLDELVGQGRSFSNFSKR